MITDRLFDRYVFVDWSASTKASRGKDSIWFATGTTRDVSPPRNPATREEATTELRDLLINDFPYGFPAGFAAALGPGPVDRPWRSA